MRHKTFPDGLALTYSYLDDANLSNNLGSVAYRFGTRGPLVTVASFSNYDANGKVQWRQTSAGSTLYHYDDFGSLQELDSTSNSGTVLQKLTYGVDLVGNIWTVTDGRPATK